MNRYYNFSKKQKNRFKERTREYAAARRRREGKPVRSVTRKDYGEKRVRAYSGCEETVDPYPLLKEARRLLWTTEEIAVAAKVDSRRVRDWKRTNMNIDAADNLCIALGTSLEIVYPYA